MGRIQAVHRVLAFAEIGLIKVLLLIAATIGSILSYFVLLGMVLGAAAVAIDLLVHFITGEGVFTRLGGKGIVDVFRTRTILWYWDLWAFALSGEGEWEPLPNPKNRQVV